METQTAENNPNNPVHLGELIKKLMQRGGKKSFLIFAQNKYFTVPVEKIAFFHVKFESCVIHCFDHQEYPISYSLEQIQGLLSDKQFFRLNRQYLINFQAVKEVEQFFGRKLIVNPIVPLKDVLLVSTDRVSDFLSWLDNR